MDVLEASQHLVQEELMVLGGEVVIGLDYLEGWKPCHSSNLRSLIQFSSEDEHQKKEGMCMCTQARGRADWISEKEILLGASPSP